MIKKRIIFVDDDQNVLDGLRNLLRKQRDQWEMAFVTSGKAALEAFEKAPFDIVVSDMRMPGMDGAELLTRIRDLYPQAARIVLSGHAEREAIARAISVAHQFLGKPSDANAVRAAVERTCEFQSLMNDDGIRRVVGSIESLPSLPSVYWKLAAAMDSPKTDLADVAAIVASDPAMGAKVLQLVNSAYFGLPQKTESILKAVSYLGTENVKTLLMATHVFGVENNPLVPGFSLERFQAEAVLTGKWARQIVRDRQYGDAAFAAGMMHDIGQLVLLRDGTRSYGQFIQKARNDGRLLKDIERPAMGVTHGMVGAYLLGTWGLPFLLTEAVAYHDEPGMVLEGRVDVLAAVHLASALVEASMAGQDAMSDGSLDREFLERAGLASEVPNWWAKVRGTSRGEGQVEGHVKP